MPAPPASGSPRRRLPGPNSYEDGGGGGGRAGRAREVGAAIAGGGVGRKIIKPEPVDAVLCDGEVPGERGRAMMAISPWTQNPRSPPSRLPVAAARPSGRSQPEIINISDDDEDEDREFRGGFPLEKVLVIEGSGNGGMRVKEEPFDYLGCNREPSTAKGKRKRESPCKFKADARGGHHAVARDSGASWAGRGAAGLVVEATRSRERKEKIREVDRGGAGDQSRPGKEVLVSSEESRGAPGKARSGRGMRSCGERGSSAAPVNRIGATVGSRIRSRARQHGRVQYGTHFAREVSDDAEEDDEGVEQEDEGWGKMVDIMQVDEVEDSGADNEVAEEIDHEEHVEGKNGEDDHGYSEDECNEGQAAAAADDDDDDEKGLDEEEGGNQEDRHSIYEGEEEIENEESEEDEEEFDGTGEEQRCTPSNSIAGGSVRSGGDGTRVFRKRIFEGICLPDKPDKTIGRGIEGRTRSKTKCKDKKLLRRGTYSKPYYIDLPDSTSESEEDIPPLVQPRGLLSSSEEYEEASRKRTKARKKRRYYGPIASDDDSEEERAFARYVGVGSSRKPKKGASNRPAVREGCKNYDGSNPGYDGSNPWHVKHNGPNAKGPTNISNAQDDLSFKRNAHIAQLRKRCRASKAKDAYDELLNSLFAEWENHTDGSDPAHVQSGDSLPVVFSFGDEEEMEVKSENAKFQEELWREFDLAFESINIGSHGCEEGEINDRKKVPPGEATSCKHGNHDFIIDEQIGVRCKHCHVVDLEIRYVLPSMGKNAAERESAINLELDSMFKEMLTLCEENDLPVSNKNGACSFGAHKAVSVWDLVPGVKEDMFPHQQDAFEFIWKKLAGGTTIEQLKRAADSDIVGGCVISHAPGTGKTRLAITFVQSYLEHFPQCRPVIIAPKGMLATWEQEFRKWKVTLPFHVLNSSEINWSEDKTIQDQVAKNGTFARRLLKDKMDQNYRRLVKLGSWMNGTSIIGVSYSLFRKLANDEGMDGDKVRKVLLEKPDLLVLDEGHTPRNKKSIIWKALANVRTEKRIILSGTPFQNNFEELYNTLCLVRPKDAMLLEKDEGKDFWTSLRLSNITKANIEKIQRKLDPVVHIHKGNFLEESLPGLIETVVILNPLPRQKEIITSMEKTAAMGTLDGEYKISLASAHPSLITCAKLSRKEAFLVDNSLLESIRLNPCEGVKTRFVLEVVRLCQVLNERVLVFSQYLEPLSLIMEQLKTRFSWTEDKEILHMSGNVVVKNRQAMMEAFNNMKSEAKVMLASTKACCEGITLVGASRVVLLDVVWNPSVGRQAIGRAYRIGQKKIVYTYNLIADGTKEMEKYNRQAKKEHMSKMLFSNELQSGGCSMSPESTFNDRILEEMTAREDLKKLFVQIRIENQTNGLVRF
ncbi:SNF2 domain-containing protein CLASSY 3-like [Phragmites australis]|uniref:SNF2 domain-containing protein CLASSY 3-like n=1 Tax=Phragmites australis TaxID=29695 RepID=UPI002D79F44B|nr:SNF2 domain-containing protein CLASSY 3-like [Phragmites australis]